MAKFPICLEVEMENKDNVWVLTVDTREGFELPCLEVSPEPLEIVKAQDRASRTVRIVADANNPMTVRLVLENGPLDQYFGDAEQDTTEIAIEPGQEVVYCLKARLGLVQRKNTGNRFKDTCSPYAQILKFDHPGLADCGHGSHTDMHVEC